MEFRFANPEKIRTHGISLVEGQKSRFFDHAGEKGEKKRETQPPAIAELFEGGASMTGEKNDGFVFIDRFICLEELCKLCHISKRKAKWLLENEIIPCVRSGNKRHRYKIKLSDAMAFQKDQESDCVIYT